MGKKDYNLDDIDLDNMTIWDRAVLMAAIPLLIIYILLVAIFAAILCPLIIISDCIVYLVDLIFHKKEPDKIINYYDNGDVF